MSYIELNEGTKMQNNDVPKKNRRFKNFKEVKHSVKKISSHLVEAANASVDIIKEKATDILDDDKRFFTVILSGNDNCGKTTLMYSAKFGKNFNKKLIVPTVGYNGEYIKIKNGESIDTLEIYDLGGGSRMGPLFYKYMGIADGIIYVISESDVRLASSLWELYILLRQLPEESKHIPVCIVILIDKEQTLTDKKNNNERYNKIAALSTRGALPPLKEKWFSDEYNMFFDKAWESDFKWIDEHKRTSSHGMQLPTEIKELNDIHTGSWTIMSIKSDKSLTEHEALIPFEWIHQDIIKYFPKDINKKSISYLLKRKALIC